jgi:IS30 family transposase
MVTSRIWFTAAQKSELWERWKQGRSISSISRALERRSKGGVQRIVSLHGGIAPSRISQAQLNAIALRLNQRPRKTLDFEAPSDRLQQVLR